MVRGGQGITISSGNSKQRVHGRLLFENQLYHDDFGGSQTRLVARFEPSRRKRVLRRNKRAQPRTTLVQGSADGSRSPADLTALRTVKKIRPREQNKRPRADRVGAVVPMCHANARHAATANDPPPASTRAASRRSVGPTIGSMMPSPRSTVSCSRAKLTRSSRSVVT